MTRRATAAPGPARTSAAANERNGLAYTSRSIVAAGEGTPQDLLEYGLREPPTLTDEQAARIYRRDRERREIRDLMEANQGIGGP